MWSSIFGEQVEDEPAQPSTSEQTAEEQQPDIGASIWSFASSTLTSLKKKSEEVTNSIKSDFAEFSKSLQAETKDLIPAKKKEDGSDAADPADSADSTPAVVKSLSTGARAPAPSKASASPPKSQEKRAAGAASPQGDSSSAATSAASSDAPSAAVSASGPAASASSSTSSAGAGAGASAGPGAWSVPSLNMSVNMTGLTETLTEGLEKIGDQVDKIGDRVWDLLPSVFGMTGPEGKPLQPKAEAKAANTSERTFRSKVESMQAARMSYVMDPKEGSSGEWEHYLTEFEPKYAAFCESQELIQMLTNAHVRKFYDELVPDVVADKMFWARYTFRLHALEREEERRKQLVSKLDAVSAAAQKPDASDFSWDDADSPASASASAAAGSAPAKATTASVASPAAGQPTVARAGPAATSVSPAPAASNTSSSSVVGAGAGAGDASVAAGGVQSEPSSAASSPSTSPLPSAALSDAKPKAAGPQALSTLAARSPGAVIKTNEPPSHPNSDDEMLSDGSGSESDSARSNRGWVDVRRKTDRSNSSPQLSPAKPAAAAPAQPLPPSPATANVVSAAAPAASAAAPQTTPVKAQPHSKAPSTPAPSAALPSAVTPAATKPAVAAAQTGLTPAAAKMKELEQDGWDVWD